MWGQFLERPAHELLHGALGVRMSYDGWARPYRFTAAQERALGSVRAWHPGLYSQMVGCTAGVRLEFDTDATTVELEIRCDKVPRGSAAVLKDVLRHNPRWKGPLDGVACVVDGKARAFVEGPRAGGPGAAGGASGENPVPSVSFSIDASDAPAGGLMRLPGMGEPHRVEIWLPALCGCELGLLRADGSYLDPVDPHGEKPRLLVLGDSIAQGFVGGDPSQSWCARLSRKMGFDLVNQGVGGQVFQPGSLMDLARHVRPAAIVVELGENYRYEPCQAGRVGREIRSYLYEVAERWPEVPTWVLTQPAHTEDVYPTHPRSCSDAVDGLIREAAAPHAQMRVVEAPALLGAACGHLPGENVHGERAEAAGGEDLAKLLADGSDHPGPRGQRLMAERLGFVMEATGEPEGVRRERAVKILQRVGSTGAPLAERLAAGEGEVLLARRGVVVWRRADGQVEALGRDAALIRRARAAFGLGEKPAAPAAEPAALEEPAADPADPQLADPAARSR